jgi:hypothetical protein
VEEIEKRLGDALATTREREREREREQRGFAKIGFEGVLSPLI